MSLLIAATLTTHTPRVSVPQLDELAAANEGVSMFPDVKDEERGTPLWVAEQRAAVEDHLSFDENAGYRIRYPYIKSPYKIIMFSVFSVTGIV